ncbi:MAG: CapA family protein [Xanthomonadales bacterium]|nr:CapA family protein [Xanthomonadales bacterium]
MRRRDFIRHTAAAAAGLATLRVSAGDAVSGMPEPAPLRLFVAGDLMLGRGVDQVLAKPSDPRLYNHETGSALEYVKLAEAANGPIPRPVDYDYIWGDALEVLEAMSPAVRLANLETTITTSDNYWRTKTIQFRMHPENVACLQAAGFDCLSLANNHALDWGYEGMRETREVLSQAGIAHSGTGDDVYKASDPAIIPLGDDRRLLFYACCTKDAGLRRFQGATTEKGGVHVLHLNSPRYLPDRIRREKREGDFVVVSIHWGSNFGSAVPQPQRSAARILIDAGADLIHGHSSHHVKSIEVYRDRPIFYGCGDLMNDYEGLRRRRRYPTDLGLMYFPEFDPQTGALLNLEMQPMRIRRFRLQHASADEANQLLDLLRARAHGTRAELQDSGRIALDWSDAS